MAERTECCSLGSFLFISVSRLFSGEKESKFFTHSDSVTMIKIMDEIRNQIKMVVEADQ